MAVIVVALSSCSVARRIPEGEYLLRRQQVEADRSAPRNERITASELNRYVQRPERGRSIFSRSRRGGELPLWSAEQTARSAENLETYIASRGFFHGTVATRIDTLRGGRKRKARVYYTVHQGDPWRIGRIDHVFRDTLLAPVVMADSAATLLLSGEIFNTATLDAERTRIATALRNHGYYDFNVGHITYIVDSTRVGQTVDIEMVVRRRLAGYEGAEPVYENHRTYTLGEIYVQPDYDPVGQQDTALDTLRTRGLNIVFRGVNGDNVDNSRGRRGEGGVRQTARQRQDEHEYAGRPEPSENAIRTTQAARPPVRPQVLRRMIQLRTDSIYSAAAVAKTSAELMRTGTFRNVSVSFEKIDSQNDTYGYLNSYIRCTPALRQSFGVEVEGTTTSSFYGLQTTLSYQNRNTFRGAELFEGSLTAGFEFLKSSTRKLSYEVGGAVSVTFPHPSTLSLSVNWQDRAYYSRMLFGLNMGYTWSLGKFQNITFRPLDINLIRMGHLDPEFQGQLNNPYLVSSFADQLIAGVSASYVFNNQPRNLDAGAVVARVNIESTGNVASGLAHAFASPTPEGHYNIFGIQFSQYIRGDGSFSHKIMLADKTAIAYRVQAGAIYAYGNSTSPPFEKLFFAGGVNSMRGWAVRTLGPGTTPYESRDYPAQMGDVKLEMNAELRFPVVGAVNGALFFDAGNIWFMRSKPDEYPDEAVFRLRNFARQLGFNTGLGARVDLRFVVLRLDWGIQLHNPGLPAGQRWIRKLRWSGTALNFGVGYPF